MKDLAQCVGAAEGLGDALQRRAQPRRRSRPLAAASSSVGEEARDDDLGREPLAGELAARRAGAGAEVGVAEVGRDRLGEPGRVGVGTSRPVWPSISASAAPPPSATTTGTPAHDASTIVRPNPS